jgi:hypothetical protein
VKLTKRTLFNDCRKRIELAVLVVISSQASKFVEPFFLNIMSREEIQPDYELVIKLSYEDQCYNCITDISGFLLSNPMMTFQDLSECVLLESKSWHDLEYKVCSASLFPNMKDLKDCKNEIHVSDVLKPLKKCFNRRIYPVFNWPTVVYFKLEKPDDVADIVIPMPVPNIRSDKIECLERADVVANIVIPMPLPWSDNMECRHPQKDIQHSRTYLPTIQQFLVEKEIPRKYRCNIKHLWGGLSPDMFSCSTDQPLIMNWNMGKFSKSHFQNQCGDGSSMSIWDWILKMLQFSKWIQSKMKNILTSKIAELSNLDYSIKAIHSMRQHLFLRRELNTFTNR